MKFEQMSVPGLIHFREVSRYVATIELKTKRRVTNQCHPLSKFPSHCFFPFEGNVQYLRT